MVAESIKKKIGANVVGDMRTGATRADSLNAPGACATAGAAGAAPTRLRVEADEPGSDAKAHAASSKIIRKTLRAVRFTERAARLASCVFNCRAVVVCRDLAGLCGDVIRNFLLHFRGTYSGWNS